MVAKTRNTRGASTLGCLLSLLITVVVVYYGSSVGRIWWRYLELKDRMKTAAMFASTQKDDQLMRNLVDDVKEIGVPPEAAKFRIERGDVPRSITISTQYTETIDIPFVHRPVPLKISVFQKL